MDDREIRAVKGISHTGKMALARPAMGRREYTYKLKQYDKFMRSDKLDPDERRQALAEFVGESESHTEPKTEKRINKNLYTYNPQYDYVEDLKRRVSFDRAMVIGDYKYR